MNSTKRGVFFALLGAVVLLAGTAEAQPAAKLLAVDRVRLLPAPGHEKALLHGTIHGSIVSAQEGFELLAEVKSTPKPGQWLELTVPNAKPYRWIKYEGPAGSYGWISKVEFYAGQRKLTGEAFAPYPTGNWRRAFDERPNTGIQGEAPDGQYVGIDVGDAASCPRPMLSPGGDIHPTAIKVTMQCKRPDAVIRYTTDGTVPTRDHGAIYSSPISVDKTTCFSAVAFCDRLAPSPAADVIYLLPPVVWRNTLHFGNSLSGNAVGKFGWHAATAGMKHKTTLFAMGGGIARTVLFPTFGRRWKRARPNGRSYGPSFRKSPT